MPTVVACPSCGGCLRVADDLLGQQVRCPACNGTFDTAAASSDRPVEVVDEAASGPRGLKGAVEIEVAPADQQPPPRPAPPPPEVPRDEEPPPTLDDFRYERRRCPECGKRVDRDAVRCANCDEYLGDDGPRRRPRRDLVRRDLEPDRGNTILTLGICSLVFCAVFWPVGIVLGIVAWVMGHGDLNKIKNKQMEPEGESLTRSGWLCGLIGTALNTLMMLGCFLFIGWMVHLSYNTPPPTAPGIRTRPGPTPAPVGPPAPGRPVRPGGGGP